MVKQAALNGSDVDSISYIIKEAAPLGSYIMQELNENLTRDRIELKDEGFDKFASKDINTDGELYRKVEDFHNETVDILKTAEELIETKKSLSDHPLLKTAKKEPVQLGTKLASVIRFIKDHPKKFLGTTGAAYIGGRYHGSTAKKSNSPMLTSNYNSNRPNRVQ